MHAATTRARENAPKAEGLITRPRDHRLAIGGHREIQHSIGVPSEGHKFLHSGVLPDDDLVEAVAVGADNLIHARGPHEVTNLRSGIDAVEGLRVERVPEADMTVGCAPARCQEPVLVRRPRHCLDRGGMIRESTYGLGGCTCTRAVPHQEFVVISPRGEMFAVERPFQTTDFLLVSREYAYKASAGAVASFSPSQR